jgi:hypothetical protein
VGAGAKQPGRRDQEIPTRASGRPGADTGGGNSKRRPRRGNRPETTTTGGPGGEAPPGGPGVAPQKTRRPTQASAFREHGSASRSWAVAIRMARDFIASKPPVRMIFGTAAILAGCIVTQRISSATGVDGAFAGSTFALVSHQGIGEVAVTCLSVVAACVAYYAAQTVLVGVARRLGGSWSWRGTIGAAKDNWEFAASIGLGVLGRPRGAFESAAGKVLDDESEAGTTTAFVFFDINHADAALYRMRRLAALSLIPSHSRPETVDVIDVGRAASAARTRSGTHWRAREREHKPGSSTRVMAPPSQSSEPRSSAWCTRLATPSKSRDSFRWNHTCGGSVTAPRTMGRSR